MMDETQSNKNVLYVILLILIVLLGFVFKFYNNQIKENAAIRIKLSTLSRKRELVPWQRLMMPPKQVEDKVTTKASSALRSTPIIAETPPPVPASEVVIQNLTTQELALTLNSRMTEVKSQSLSELEKNIEFADEIISRVPDSYSAYKAKLISLLIAEGKFNYSIDDSTVNQILETMASFNLAPQNEEEANLLSTREDELTSLGGELEQITGRLQNLDAEVEILNASLLPPVLEENRSPYSGVLEEIPTKNMEMKNEIEEIGTSNPIFNISSLPNPLDLRALETERQILLAREQEISDRIEQLNSLPAPTSAPVNEDVVQIPFLRMMAKNDFEGVINDAETFIEQFPTSATGYYFLIKGLEVAGRHDEAASVLTQPSLTKETQNILEARLRNSSDEKFEKYWENLNF